MASVPLTTVLMLAALSLLPLLFMTATSFVKISVVFSILRNALGTGQVPSGIVVAALSAILSLYVMAPVGSKMLEAAAPAAASVNWNAPLGPGSFEALQRTLKQTVEPLRQWLARHANPKETSLFLELARQARPVEQRALLTKADLLVVFPAFLITELSEAFLIGFLIFLPFLIIDLVIANIALALGMQTLSPTTISLPFKLLLFVAVDGWYLLSRALLAGYS